MSEVVGWLSELGLDHLRQTFERNHIGLSLVPRLTEQDLKDLGISAEDRRRLEAGIRKLGEGAPSLAQHENSEGGPAPLALADSALRSVERRQLSVLFCALVGSSALSTRLDPEDLNYLVNAYRDACVGPIERHGGFVSRLVGDGILACFGYPHAHEDDAERAVWAGLGIID